jgi:hypothetical protein
MPVLLILLSKINKTGVSRKYSLAAQVAKRLMRKSLSKKIFFGGASRQKTGETASKNVLLLPKVADVSLRQPLENLVCAPARFSFRGVKNPSYAGRPPFLPG